MKLFLLIVVLAASVRAQLKEGAVESCCLYDSNTEISKYANDLKNYIGNDMALRTKTSEDCTAATTAVLTGFEPCTTNLFGLTEGGEGISYINAAAGMHVISHEPLNKQFTKGSGGYNNAFSYPWYLKYMKKTIIFATPFYRVKDVNGTLKPLKNVLRNLQDDVKSALNACKMFGYTCFELYHVICKHATLFPNLEVYWFNTPFSKHVTNNGRLIRENAVAQILRDITNNRITPSDYTTECQAIESFASGKNDANDLYRDAYKSAPNKKVLKGFVGLSQQNKDAGWTLAQTDVYKLLAFTATDAVEAYKAPEVKVDTEDRTPLPMPVEEGQKGQQGQKVQGQKRGA